MNISDKDLLSSGLFALKHMAMVYNNTATETDDPQIAGELCQMISDTHGARIKLYEAMRQRGWYNAQLIDQQQLQTTQQQLAQQLQQTQHWQSPTGQYTGGFTMYQPGIPSSGPQMSGRPQTFGQ